VTAADDRRGRAEWALALCVVAATTVISTWPLVTSPWLIPAHQDPLFSCWRLYQWARNLTGGLPDGLFGGNIFHPTPDVLLFSDALVLPSWISVPFIASGVPPVVAYSALVWLAFLSAGLAMYACARELTGSVWGALVAAVIFTGAPVRIEHVMHLELLWTGWMPLALLRTARLFAGRLGGAWLLGGSLVGQVLCCIYYGVFLFTVWPLAAGVEWLRARRTIARPALVRAAAAVALAAIVTGLYARPYQRAREVVGDRFDDEVLTYSATLSSYAVSAPSNRAWGWTAVAEDYEGRLFPGLIAGGLAVSALAAPAAPWTLALAATTVVGIDASTGLNGVTYPVLRRFAPPYRGLRVPARFGAVTLFGVALLAAIGCANLARNAGQWRGAPVAAAVVLLATILEYAAQLPLRPMPRQAPPVYALLATLPPTVVAHAPLPLPDGLPGAEADFQYFAQYHRHELLNGNSGFYPPVYMQLLERARGFPDDRAIQALRSAGAEYLLVHERYYPSRPAFGRVIGALEARTDLKAVTTSLDDAGLVRVYHLLPQ
jgi:hypothetical protein